MSELPAGHRRALLEVAAALGGQDVPFGVGGSALLALLGIPVTVGDLDVLVPVGIDPPPLPWPAVDPGLPPGPVASDWILRGRVLGVSVDLMSGLRVDTGSGVVEVPIDGGGVADVGGVEVALSSPRAWRELYRRHRPQRAELLEEWLDS